MLFHFLFGQRKFDSRNLNQELRKSSPMASLSQIEFIGSEHCQLGFQISLLFGLALLQSHKHYLIGLFMNTLLH
jgi:hypothetical protein